MSRFRHLLFPLALALILGGLSAWLERISEISVEEVKLDPDKPQYAMTQLTGKRFDENGLPKETIIAEKGWQLPDQKEVFFQDMKLNIYYQNKNNPNNLNNQEVEEYQLHAKQARYHLEDKKGFLENQVILKKLNNPNNQDIELKTDYLMIDTQAQTAQTDSLVEFTQGDSKGSSKGLFYNHQLGKLDLPAQVKALIYPNLKNIKNIDNQDNQDNQDNSDNTENLF